MTAPDMYDVQYAPTGSSEPHHSLGKARGKRLQPGRQDRRKAGVPGVVQRGDVVADTSYVGPGCGIPQADTLEAIRMFAELEGILLNPA